MDTTDLKPHISILDGYYNVSSSPVILLNGSLLSRSASETVQRRWTLAHAYVARANCNRARLRNKLAGG